MTTRLTGDVAIVGMSCIFPGAPSVRAYWENILAKVDAVSDPPESWLFNEDYDPNSSANDKIYCKRGGHLGDLAEFNPVKYGVMPRAVDGADPEQFLALRVAYETFEDAGYSERPFNRQKTAVILGRGAFPNRGLGTGFQHGLVVNQTLRILKQLHPEYTDQELAEIKRELKASVPPFNGDTTPGTVSNIMCGRIANRLDLQGPNYGVDAACAASVLAVDLGMRELLSGRCDMALTGGVSVFCSGALNLVFCQLGALSRRGEIRPFDRRADGTLLGSGVGMVLLKRLEDAKRDGDRIYAVIKGVGIASDGRAMGMLAPRAEGEELAIRRAYEATGIDPASIRLVEAHGTGTPVGDAAEIQALTRVFGLRNGDRPTCALGSVKSMISHLIPAAGIAGLIKTALALHHKVLPPTINCEEPNPELELEKTPFYLATEPRPWIHGDSHPRRAGLNAFGFGGINTHTILEEYRGAGESECPSFMHRWDTEVFIVQGHSREALVQSAQRLAEFLARKPDVSAKDLAYTLNCPLDPAGERLAIVAESLDGLAKKLDYALQRLREPQTTAIRDRSGIYYFEEPLGGDSRVAFLFPGEGCQYPDLLWDLCIHFPEVRACFDRGNQVWGDAWSELLPSEVLFPPPSPNPADGPAVDERIWDLDVATAAVYMADYAVYQLLSRLNVTPDFLAGHSSGELTALFSSGALVAKSDDEVINYCMDLLRTGRSVSDEVPAATLMTVGISDPQVVDELLNDGNGDIEVAMDNCPHQVILCGPRDVMATARERLQKSGAICTMLPYHRAYHTPRYQPVSDEFFELFQGWEFIGPPIPVYSCATAQPYPADPREVRRWAADQWARPVRFRATIEALYEAGARIFVEVGPRANLSGFVEDILQERPFLAIPSNVHYRSGISQLGHLLGMLAAHGLPLQLDYLYHRREPTRVPLDPPTEKDAGSKPKLSSMILPLEIPRLKLRDSSCLRGSYARHAPGRQGATAPQTTDADGQQSPTQVVPQAMAPDSSAPLAARGKSTAEKPVNTHCDSHRGQRALVMQNYLQTMEHFLQMQQRVVSSYMAKAARPKPQPSTSEEEPIA